MTTKRSYIGAVWYFDEHEAYNINSEFSDAIWVLLSECGTIWCGHTVTFASSAGVIFQPGDPMPETGLSPLDTVTFPECWDSVRRLLIADNLGAPKWGNNPLVAKKVTTNSCKCDTPIVLTRGCPSNKGLPCPRRKMTDMV